MKPLRYFFMGLIYVGVFGFFGVLFLVTGIDIYRAGVIAWFFGGGIGDAFRIFGLALMQPLSWGFLALAGVGVLGSYAVHKRLARSELPDEPN